MGHTKAGVKESLPHEGCSQLTTMGDTVVVQPENPMTTCPGGHVSAYAMPPLPPYCFVVKGVPLVVIPEGQLEGEASTTSLATSVESSAASRT
jgi:hypothetical protein